MRKEKKKILLILIIITLFLLLRFFINTISIKLYNKNIYSETLAKSLQILNINEPYIAYYNYGNIKYQKEEYEKAISLYEKSLKKHPPENRICQIRVNLAHATFNTIEVSDKEQVLNDLKKTREILYKDGCAKESDNTGKDKNAEELDDEIQQLEEEIKNYSDQDDNNNSNNDDDNEENDDNNDDERNIEKKIMKNKKNANSARQSEMDQNESLDSYKDYYSGKRW